MNIGLFAGELVCDEWVGSGRKLLSSGNRRSPVVNPSVRTHPHHHDDVCFCPFWFSPAAIALQMSLLAIIKQAMGGEANRPMDLRRSVGMTPHGDGGFISYHD